MRRFAPIPVLLLLAACATAPAPTPAPRARELLVVATNDFHGALEPTRRQTPEGQEVELGGIARFAGYLQALRRQAPVVLVDAGDMWQGTLVSNLGEGAAVVELYNALGYDAAALGNHEFDFGPVGPARSATSPDENPFGALEARAAEARFPFLAANLFDEAGGRPTWVRPSALVERDGIRVGIVGLATPETPRVTAAANVRGLVFGDPLEAAIAEGQRLRDRVDLLLLLAHMGAVCEGARCEGELIELLERLPPGLYDAAIGGHTHQIVQTEVNGVAAIESGARGRHFGLLHFVFDPATGAVDRRRIRAEAGKGICSLHDPATFRCDEEATGALQPPVLFGEPVEPDEAIARRVRDHLARVEEERRRSVGARLAAPARLAREEESEVGNLVADAMLDAVPGADLAITNTGGLRADLPAGDLGWGALFETLPFDNGLTLLRVRGGELRQLVRAGFAGVHGGLQVSRNVRVVIDRGAQAACAVADLDGDGAVTPLDRDRLVELWVDGRPVEEDREYRVVTNDFLAGGGDGWGPLVSRLPPERKVDLLELPLQREIVAAWLSQRKVIEPRREGRIEVRGTPPSCPPGR